MAAYNLSMNVGEGIEDVRVNSGASFSDTNYAVWFNDGIDRSDAIRCLHIIADKLDQSTVAEPPAAFS